MKHLSDEELLDIAEGTAAPRHVESCERCRRQLADARAMLLALEEDEERIPEPSPLFWDHLSARIREAVAAEPAPRGRPTWARRWRLAAYSGVAAALLVAAVGWNLRPAASAPSSIEAGIATASSTSDTTREAPRDMQLFPDRADEPSFAFISDVANQADVDPAIAAGVGAYGADHAVSHLTEPELRALAELLKKEMPNGRQS